MAKKAEKKSEGGEEKATKKSAKKSEAKADAQTAANKDAKGAVCDYGIFITPLITEKSATLGSQGTGRGLAFRVQRTASKDQIKAAVKRVFGVEVESVRTCNYMGKMKRTNRSMGRRAAFKKAYVTLKEGQTFDIIEGL